jgi:hypothetical protein
MAYRSTCIGSPINVEDPSERSILQSAMMWDIAPEGMKVMKVFEEKSLGVYRSLQTQCTPTIEHSA